MDKACLEEAVQPLVARHNDGEESLAVARQQKDRLHKNSGPFAWHHHPEAPGRQHRNVGVDGDVPRTPHRHFACPACTNLRNKNSLSLPTQNHRGYTHFKLIFFNSLKAITNSAFYHCHLNYFIYNTST